MYARERHEGSVLVDSETLPPRVLHVAPGSGRPSGIESYSRAFRESLRRTGVRVRACDGRELASGALTDYDLVHAELGGGCQPEFWAATAVARAAVVPLVLTLHDPPRIVWRPFDSAPRSRSASACRSLIMRRPSRRAENFLAHRASGVFVLSDAAVGPVRQTFGLADSLPIHVLPFPSRAPAAPLPRDRRDAFVVGFHGFWYRSKGIEILLEALARTRLDAQPVRARLWGEPLRHAEQQARSYRDDVLARISKLGLENLVAVEGTIPHSCLYDRLREVDAVVLPYRRSAAYAGLASSSGSAADARAAGVPVVASDVRALRSQLRDEVDSLIVPPEDVDALAHALRRLRDDRPLRDRLTRAASVPLAHGAGDAAAELYRAVLQRPALARA